MSIQEPPRKLSPQEVEAQLDRIEPLLLRWRQGMFHSLEPSNPLRPDETLQLMAAIGGMKPNSLRMVMTVDLPLKGDHQARYFFQTNRSGAEALRKNLGPAGGEVNYLIFQTDDLGRFTRRMVSDSLLVPGQESDGEES